MNNKQTQENIPDIQGIEDLISLKEASKLSGLSHSHLCKLVREGQIKGVDYQSIKEFITIKTSQQSTNNLDSEITDKTGNETIFPEIDSKEFPELLLAHKAINRKDLEEAVQNYSNLIKSEQALPIVIQDLEELTTIFPKEVSIWQTLGDAYFRDNLITKAMAAYAKAEVLLK